MKSGLLAIFLFAVVVSPGLARADGENTPAGAVTRVERIWNRNPSDTFVVEWRASDNLQGCWVDGSTSAGKATLSLLTAAWLAGRDISVTCWKDPRAKYISDFDANDHYIIAYFSVK